MRDPQALARHVRAAVWVLILSLWGATIGAGVFTGEWPALWWLATQAVVTCVVQITAYEWTAPLVAAGPPPSGVTVTLPDGRVLPLDCVYDGKTDDGRAVWRAVVTEAVADPDGIELDADMLPARSVLALEFYSRGTP